MTYRHCICLLLLCTFTASSAQEEDRTDYDEYSIRLMEVDRHPNGDSRKLVREHGFEIAALKSVSLSPEQQRQSAAIHAQLEKDQKAWDARHGEEFAEALAMTKKYRFMKGKGINELYREWHHKKNKLSQSRPRMDAAKLIAVLDDQRRAQYEKELASFRFWYGHHGEKVKDIRLIQAGATPREAVALRREWSQKMRDHKERARKEQKTTPPSFDAILKRVQAANAGKKNLRK